MLCEVIWPSSEPKADSGVKESCLERLILFGEGSIRRAVVEFTVHYHSERNHQGLDNKLISPDPKLLREGADAKGSGWADC